MSKSEFGFVEENTEHTGLIVEMHEDGLPVIYRFENELPSEDVRLRLPWLTVISWKYDGGSRNGMPPGEVNEKMIALEDVIEDNILEDNFCRHAYSRTGNNLKEFVLYIHDRQIFIDKFNQNLKEHPKYPIEINFYNDAEWKDFREILDSVQKK